MRIDFITFHKEIIKPHKGKKMFSRFNTILIILFATLMIFSQICSAETTSKGGIGKMQGHTTYTIGGKAKVKLSDGSIISGYTHNPLSRLEFSLDVNMAQLGISHLTDNGWQFSGSFFTNISKETGKMKDSDWGIDGDSSDTLSIYSESDSELYATIVDLEVLKDFPLSPSMKLQLGGNYLYEYFDYEISNTHQYSPSGLSGYDADVSGKTLEYEITYSIVFIVAKLSGNIGNVDLSGGYLFSVSAMAEDRDNHVLRSKISTTEARGNASAIVFAISYPLTEDFDIGFEYTKYNMSLTGTQNQETYGTWTAEINNEITSDQELMMLMASYRF